MINCNQLSFPQMVKKINAKNPEIEEVVFGQDLKNWYVEQMMKLNWQYETLQRLRTQKIVERNGG